MNKPLFCVPTPNPLTEVLVAQQLRVPFRPQWTPLFFASFGIVVLFFLVVLVIVFLMVCRSAVAATPGVIVVIIVASVDVLGLCSVLLSLPRAVSFPVVVCV